MLDHIILTVSGVDRSLAFYQAALKPLNIKFFIPYTSFRVNLPRRRQVRDVAGRALLSSRFTALLFYAPDQGPGAAVASRLNPSIGP
jgi:catechol 2,3-dioxygenase-like lactoylglutathione lyase family enzyme